MTECLSSGGVNLEGAKFFACRWRNNCLEMIMQSHETVDTQHLPQPTHSANLKHTQVYACLLLPFNKVSGKIGFVSVDG